jgi:adenylate kinase
LERAHKQNDSFNGSPNSLQSVPEIYSATMSRIKPRSVFDLSTFIKILQLMRLTGIKAESTMRSGALVPDAMILRLILHELKARGWLFPPGGPTPMTLSSASMSAVYQDFDTDSFVEQPSLASMDDPSASFILDGFPRTAGQASQLDSLIPINLVVSLKTPFEVILERIAGRWVHAPSGRVYNTTFNAPKVPGKDDITGEPLTKRSDDDEETWKARLKKFEETSEPLLEHYERKGVLWTVEGNSSDEISPKLYEEFEKRFATGP